MPRRIKVEYFTGVQEWERPLEKSEIEPTDQSATDGVIASGPSCPPPDPLKKE
jgi:hypothetical protein